MFFDSWTSIGRTLLSGLFAYVFLVALLRVSGKRTLAKMNAFGLVVTVALGSTLASTIVSRSTPLIDGLVALALLAALQYVVAWSSLRVHWLERVVKSEPTLLVYRGEIRDDARRGQRVSREEIMAALRGGGLARMEDAGAVVLETDGSFSVIHTDALPPVGTTSPVLPG